MVALVKQGKKYAGQQRWENDLLDIRRIADAPRVGKVNGTERSITIGGKPVRFDLVLLHDLLRRREYGVENDNLRSRAYDGGGGGGSSELTQTEAAALRGLPDAEYNAEGQALHDDWAKHVQRDPVGIQLEEAFAQLDIAARAMRTFEKKVEIILNVSSRAKEEQDKATQCMACGNRVTNIGEDRRKSGYGPCCYWRWLEWKAQQDYDGVDISPVVFQKVRKAELDEAARLEREGA